MQNNRISAADPLDYLEDCVSKAIRGIVVRDLDEAFSAVRSEMERLRGPVRKPDPMPATTRPLRAPFHLHGLEPLYPDTNPVCSKCRVSIEEYELEMPTATTHCPYGPSTGSTGEVIVTVECHGEKWTASNLRGKIK